MRYKPTNDLKKTLKTIKWFPRQQLTDSTTMKYADVFGTDLMEYKKYNECKIGLFCVDNQNFGLGFSYWP
jgi:hypothetical protein